MEAMAIKTEKYLIEEEPFYIFIDDVKKLPNKITEIYRRLTG